MARKSDITWETHRVAWIGSGQSQRTYAEEHGLSVSSFSRWMRKLNEGKRHDKGFIPVRMPEGIKPKDEVLIIRGRRGVRLEVPLEINLDRLRELIRIMETPV